ncbi:hypothetical protein ACG02S_25315 [Roseateles sp. DC23W]|uniref:Uncharacterized protein n=1 Tax=Pelomonas dachongensis TaxID=3299029 RepID=A0ABW7EX92_9BURK
MDRKPDPLETRSKLAERFPRWTQPFWTWLTGIAMPDAKPLHRWTFGTHLGALLFAWLATLALGTWAVAALLRLVFGTA